MSISQNFQERRKDERSQGMIPVEMEAGTGMTRDFSASGVFFQTDQSLAPGMPVAFALRLERAYPDKPGRLHCEGKVLRVELRETGKMGVAASIHTYSFEEFRNPAVA